MSIVTEISIKWSIEDVLSIAPELSSKQASDVLQIAKRNHDAQVGINWDVLECIAKEVFVSSLVERKVQSETSKLTLDRWKKVVRHCVTNMSALQGTFMFNDSGLIVIIPDSENIGQVKLASYTKGLAIPTAESFKDPFSAIEVAFDAGFQSIAASMSELPDSYFTGIRSLND